MPQSDGEVVYRLVADDSGIEKDIREAGNKIEKQAKKTKESVAKESKNAADSVKDAADKSVKELKQAEKSADGVSDALEDIKPGDLEKVAESAEQAGEGLSETAEQAEKTAEAINGIDPEVLNRIAEASEQTAQKLDVFCEKTDESSGKTNSFASGALKAVGAGFAAVGGAAVAAGGYAIKAANDMDGAMNSFAASTGIAEAEMDRYQDVLEGIYANNYGEDFQDIADSMASVKQNLGDLSDESLQKITEGALTLRDTFGYEVPESTRAAKAMMDNFGISGEEALSLIAAGAQNGLDYSGELIDSINEYSVQFAKVGLDADDMFHIFEKGAESGAWNLDKVGDAIKEFSIRAIDGSTTTAEGFAAIGLNADTMAAKFAAGGDSAKAAFQETIDAIASMEDPLAQDAAGVALFGTMWEDLGVEAVTALADIEDGAYDAEGALAGIQKVKYNDLGSMLEGLKRSVELMVLPLGEMLIPMLTEIIQDIMPILEESLPIIIEEIAEFLPPIMELAEALLPVLIDAFEMLMPVLTDMIKQLMPPLIDLFSELMPIIMDLAVSLLPPLVAVFEALMPVLLEVIDALLPPLVELLGKLQPAVEALTPVIEALALMIADILREAIELVMPVIEDLMTVLGDVLEFITDVFAGDWESAWDNIVEVFKGIFNLLPEAVEAVLNGAIKLINAMIGGINDITEEIGINAIPTIGEVSLPRFHTGGIIDFSGEYESPIMAKDGEMVLTQEQQKRLFDIANGFAPPDSGYPYAQGGMPAADPESNETYYIALQVDSEVLADAFVDKADMKQGAAVALKNRGVTP